ncbi:MAG: response regulator [candidate division KSB1 bacterium]|nr:response regulator [candidate division KSB1 bacterium]MDZ7304826.1 response regulator [candidate division KSB1 bacterium]MDZ7313906.1 response regulator [candidate division KSB1 bacterium]
MERKKILIAEKQPNEVSELRKALVTAGYEVRIVTDGAEALALVESFRPDLILAEIRLPVLDGLHLLHEIRKHPTQQFLPFILTGSLKTLDERISVLKQPIDDYLQKPLDADEAAARIDGLIREAELRIIAPERQARGFSGNLSEMTLVDLLQTLEVGNKNAVVRLRHAGKEGTVFLTEGQVIDATLDDLETRRALLRMFTWTEGTFQVEIRTHDRQRLLTMSTRDLISEGLTRMHRWEQILQQLPPLQSVVGVNGEASGAKLTDEETRLLQLVPRNGSKRIIDLVEESQSDDLRALTVVKNLYQRNILKTMPLPKDQRNGDYLATLRTKQKNGRTTADWITGAFKAMLKKPEPPPPRQHERRRFERRYQEDRRKHDRRRDSQQREKTRIFLNKSELIMIRESLSQTTGKK